MDNQKRFILFIVISMIIVGLTSYFTPPAPPAPKVASTTTSQSPAPRNQETLKAKPSKETVSSYHKISAQSAKETNLETEDYLASFSNRGAVLTSFKLKKYLDRQTHQPIQLVNPGAQSEIHLDEDLSLLGLKAGTLASCGGPIALNDKVQVDSYRSSQGAYRASTSHSMAQITSATDATQGPEVKIAGTLQVHHALELTPLPTPAPVNPEAQSFVERTMDSWLGKEPSSAKSLGNVSVEADKTLILTQGDYIVGTLKVSPGAKLVAKGKVRIWFTDGLLLEGEAYPESRLPKDLLLLSSGLNPNLAVKLNQGQLTGFLFAPNALVDLNASKVFGGLVGSSVSVNPLPHPHPFSLDYAPFPNANQELYEVEGSSRVLSKKDEETKLTFRADNGKGGILEKSFTFKNGSFLIHMDLKVSQRGGASLVASPLQVGWSDNLGREENTGTQSRVQGYRVATLTGENVSFENVKKSTEGLEVPAPVGWTALANQFFVATLIPDPSTGAASVKVVRDFNALVSPSEDNPNPEADPKIFTPRPVLCFAGDALSPGESFHRKAQVYIGPQDYDLLEALHLKLERVIDFGFFGKLSVYMLKLLKWFFFAMGHNWGLAIILLSIAVKLALWLPTHSSYKSMYQMNQKTKELQPKLEALKRKYADDKGKLNQETTLLYQQAGINPMGGCLPMLLQMPVIFALYGTLGHSIELRSATFLWLKDLTLRDPFFVLPLLMGATMIVQQKVSGQMANQASGQQKMMMWMMPVVLTFFSIKWPSGLLVYWVVTNVLSMIQQKIVNREIQKAKKKVEETKP